MDRFSDLTLTVYTTLRHRHSLLKVGIWIYFILLIFEGALRKWFLPGLSAPLLIIRDPLAVWLVAVAWKNNMIVSSVYLKAMLTVALFGIVTGLILGHGNVAVILFGARILLLHFPLIFVMGSVLNSEDVIRFGRVMLWISIPMIVIIALQFFSPQAAWINRGVGGDLEGAGFSGALGYFRPPGTFSFTNGNTLFFSFLSVFVLYFWVNQQANRILLVFATLALIASIPFSISRGLFFSVIISVFFTIVALLIDKSKPSYTIFIIGIVLSSFFFLISQLELLKAPLEAFTSRFETASDIEGGLEGTIIDRYFGDLVTSFTNDPNLPFWGYGMGMGTNVGSTLLTGSRSFLIAEGEWGRLLGEMGILLGSLAILIRLGFCLSISLKSYQFLKGGSSLSWFILSFVLLNIPQGQWAQPTALGFAIFSGGLLMASFNSEDI